MYEQLQFSEYKNMLPEVPCDIEVSGVFRFQIVTGIRKGRVIIRVYGDCILYLEFKLLFVLNSH